MTAHSYITEHRTVLIIYPLILQTIIIAQMLSNRREGDINHLKCTGVR